MAKVQPGAGVSELRGSVNGMVFARTRSGYVLRRKPRYKPTFTATQQAAQQRLAAAMAAWNTLTHAQAMAWNAFAATLLHVNSTDGTTYRPTGQNVFASLASKFLQINPTGTIPLAPPAAAFPPDDLLVAVTGGTGQITFTATGPNTPPAQTELLVQKLKNERRTPTDKYVSQDFAAFTPDSLSRAVSLEPGWYACAYRFVNADTGQMTELLTRGVVQVE